MSKTRILSLTRVPESVELAPPELRTQLLLTSITVGRTLDNALLNLGLKDKFATGLDKLGFNMENVLDSEREAAFGNGGLGRLAACYIDSGATCELPLWGYGLKYQYGTFQQLIAPDGSQLEAYVPSASMASLLYC